MLEIVIHQKNHSFKLSMRHSSSPGSMRTAHSPALSDIGAYIGHGLATGHARPRNLGADVASDLQKVVPPLAGLINVVGLQRRPGAAGRAAGVVDCGVTPPGAVSVGRLGGPSRGLGCGSRCCGRGSGYGYPRTKCNTGDGTSAVLSQNNSLRVGHRELAPVGCVVWGTSAAFHLPSFARAACPL